MENERRALLPSERADAEAKAKRELELRARARAEMMYEDFTRTFQTAHGKRVLKWLQERSGHNKIILSANGKDGTIDTMLTTFAAMELNLYLEVRKHLPPQLLMEIEYGHIEPSGTIAEPDTGNTVERAGTKRKSGTRTKRE